MAAYHAHHVHFAQGLPRLSARQRLWLKDGASGVALVIFIASVFAVF